MKIRDTVRRLDRLQNARLFKIIASGVVVVVALGVIIGYLVAINAPAEAGSALAAPPPPAAGEEMSEAERQFRSQIDATVKVIENEANLGFAAGSRLDLRFGFGLTILCPRLRF